MCTWYNVNVVFAYKITQQNCTFTMCVFFTPLGYSVHQGTTYGKKEYDKRQRYTQPTPFGYQLDTNEMQSHRAPNSIAVRGMDIV